MTTHFFLHKNNFIVLYKYNEAHIYPKIKNKLRTIEAQLQMHILLKNPTHPLHACGVSLQVFLQLETPSEQRRESKLCRTCFKNS